MYLSCPTCSTIHEAVDGSVGVGRCTRCDGIIVAEREPGENPEPTGPPPEPPPAPPAPTRTCLVCLGEGSFPLPGRTNIATGCATCKGAGTVADPEFDALVKRVEALEDDIVNLHQRCDAFSARR